MQPKQLQASPQLQLCQLLLLFAGTVVIAQGVEDADDGDTVVVIGICVFAGRLLVVNIGLEREKRLGFLCKNANSSGVRGCWKVV
jgi:uncharacterized membrane protein YgdD (TMEM256/DUF423 family)